jgi:tetratricopeptide (TPR) repeat protein
MPTLKLLLLLLSFSLYSCAQNTAGHKSNPEAVRLSQQVIPLYNYTDNPDSCRKALLFLDSAIEIDSNDFLIYYNTLFFLEGLKQYDKEIKNMNEMIRLRPHAHNLFLMRGGIYEKTGDTISAKKDFQKSLSICNQVLDTMSKNNQDYFMFVTNKAVNLIMLNDSADANKILKALYENYAGNSEWDKVDKEYILSLMNKNKQQLMQPPPAKDSETDIYLNQ